MLYSFHQLPPVTRTYVTLCILTTAACALEVSEREGGWGEGNRSEMKNTTL